MKTHLTKQRRFIRKPSMTAGTVTTLNSHHLQHSLLTPQEGTAKGTLFGTPPSSKNVATNVGRSFLKVLDEEFPNSHPLHKIFNRNTVKISYSCMTSIKQKIDGHNKSTLRKRNVPSKTCNCRQPDNCPMAGHCLKSSVVYQATAAASDNRPVQTYVGLTENFFKTRFANHKSSFRDPNKRLSTELRKHIWHLKDSKLEFKITWKILKQAVPFNPASNRCNLCLWEKYFIICRPDLATLNKRNELVTSCRHGSKFLVLKQLQIHLCHAIASVQIQILPRTRISYICVCCNGLFIWLFYLMSAVHVVRYETS